MIDDTRWAIFDIDGTLLDNRHREHLRGTDWAEYHRLTDSDTLMTETIAVAEALLLSDWKIVFATGRPESVRAVTTDQLRLAVRHGAVERTGIFSETRYPSTNNIMMRPDGDRSANHRLKRKMLREMRRVGVRPSLVFEDNPEAVRMWVEEGLTCLTPYAK